jgi:sulfide:quinone oxidoreductase
MERPVRPLSVRAMNDQADFFPRRTTSAPTTRALIAGGGIAALEAMLALRALGEERVAIEILAPDAEFTYRPLSVAAPFGLGEPLRFDLEELVRRSGAEFHRGALKSVNPAAGQAVTDTGARLQYDFLLVAAGVGRRNPLPGSLAFGGEGEIGAFRDLLHGIERGEVRRVAFALTSEAAWSLPLYELALMTAAFRIKRRIRSVELTLVSSEERPLAAFGPEAAELVRRRLSGAGIRLVTSEHAYAYEDGFLSVVPEDEIAADQVVTLAAPEPPRFEGLPTDPEGFIPADTFGRVPGLDGVFAAGDITSFPLKQGGIAAQQADAAAEWIAAASGALVTPRPFRPVLRGLLLTGGRPAYIRTEVSGGRGPDLVDAEPLWWPPAKVVAKYLGPYLAEQAGTAHPQEIDDPEGLLVAWESNQPDGDLQELSERQPEFSA